MKGLLIFNPKAGRTKASPLVDISKFFAEAPFFELTVHETLGPGDATQAARRAAEQGYDVAIAAGGDGSIFEVANGLVGSRTALGVIPLGTENVLAREMGVPLRFIEACRHLLERPPRCIDTGRLGEQHFVCFAGIGFDAHVAHALPSARKKQFGALAYFLTSAEKIHSYSRSSRKLKLTLDGEVVELEFWILVVSNIRRYGGGLIPAPRAKIDDGYLDVCVFPRADYLQLMRQMVATRAGRHLTLPGVRYFQAKKIVIESIPPEQIQLDGEAWPGTTPVTIEVAPRSLWVRI